MTRLHAVALVVFCGALAHLRSMETVQSYGAQAAPGAQEPGNQSWSPGVQKAPETSPPLSPADEMKHFYLPPGYRVELVASEPLVQDPIAVDWDADGRLWVVEYPEYVPNLTDPEPNLEPDGPDQRARRHRQRRQDGQAHGLCRWARAGTVREGARPRHPRPRTARHLVDEKHQRQSEDGTKEKVGTDQGVATAASRGTRTRCVGVSTTTSFRRIERVITAALERWDVGGAPDVVARRIGDRQDNFGRMFRNSSEATLQVNLVPTPYLARTRRRSALAGAMRSSPMM